MSANKLQIGDLFFCKTKHDYTSLFVLIRFKDRWTVKSVMTGNLLHLSEGFLNAHYEKL